MSEVIAGREHRVVAREGGAEIPNQSIQLSFRDSLNIDFQRPYPLAVDPLSVVIALAPRWMS